MTWTGTRDATWGVMVGAAESAAEQVGQTWDPVDSSRSVQKWICAPRKATTRSTTTNCILDFTKCMCLVRRSLGKKGCGVKELSRVIKAKQPIQNTYV